MILVNRKFVPTAAETGAFVQMQNTTRSYSVAMVTIGIDECTYCKEVAVSEQLKEDAVLGMDVILWLHLVK